MWMMIVCYTAMLLYNNTLEGREDRRKNLTMRRTPKLTVVSNNNSSSSVVVSM